MKIHFLPENHSFIFGLSSIITLGITAMLLLSACIQNKEKDRNKKIENAIRAELALHPEATLTDIYKNFFQGRFGPGHMISDPEAAREYLLQELEFAQNFDTVPWQTVGYEDRYYRINLIMVKDSLISIEDLADAFIQSANQAATPDIESWTREWDLILSVIEDLELSLPGFEEDRRNIAKNLEKGIIVGHHSDIYRKNYHPHYRIVTKEEFQRLKAN